MNYGRTFASFRLSASSSSLVLTMLDTVKCKQINYSSTEQAYQQPVSLSHSLQYGTEYVSLAS